MLVQDLQNAFPDDGRFKREVTFSGKSGVAVSFKVSPLVASEIQQYERMLSQDDQIRQRFAELYSRYGYVGVAYSDPSDEMVVEYLIDSPGDDNVRVSSNIAAILWLATELTHRSLLLDYTTRSQNSVCYALQGSIRFLSLIISPERDLNCTPVIFAERFSYFLGKLLLDQEVDQLHHLLTSPGLFRRIIGNTIAGAMSFVFEHETFTGEVFSLIQKNLLELATSHPPLGKAVSYLLGNFDSLMDSGLDLDYSALEISSSMDSTAIKTGWRKSVSNYHFQAEILLIPRDEGDDLRRWLTPLQSCVDEVVAKNAKKVCFDTHFMGYRNKSVEDEVARFQFALFEKFAVELGFTLVISDTFQLYSRLIDNSGAVWRDVGTSGPVHSLAVAHLRMIEFFESKRPLGYDGLRDLFGVPSDKVVPDNIESELLWWVKLDELRRRASARIKIKNPNLYEGDWVSSSISCGETEKELLITDEFADYEDDCLGISQMVASANQIEGTAVADILGYAAYRVGQRVGWGDCRSSLVRYAEATSLLQLVEEIKRKKTEELASLKDPFNELRDFFGHDLAPRRNPSLVVFTLSGNDSDDSSMGLLGPSVPSEKVPLGVI